MNNFTVDFVVHFSNYTASYNAASSSAAAAAATATDPFAAEAAEWVIAECNDELQSEVYHVYCTA
jgi:hypothetical protein